MGKIIRAKMNKCDNCGCSYVGHGHNGAPLVDGFVCDACNGKVMIARIKFYQNEKNKGEE